jgi:hypothetical protein
MIICHNARVKEGRGAGEVDPTRPARRRSSSGEAEEGGRKEGERVEADRWGRHDSERKKKEKGDGGVGCCATGPKGKRGEFSPFFSNPFQNNLLNSNSNQTFSNFSHNFYNLFRSHTSNQKPCKAN